MTKSVREFIALMFVGAGTIGIMSMSRPVDAAVRASDTVELHEGQMFPTMIFPSLEGSRPGSVADFRGKKLILHIFASW